MKRNLVTVLIAALPMFVFAQATVNTGDYALELLRTDQGCGIYMPKSANYPGVSVAYQWSGRCMNGLAEGFGRTSSTVINQGTKSPASTTTGQRRAGIAIGHSISELGDTGFLIKGWSYTFSGRSVGSMSRGVSGVDPFISVSEATLANPNISMPDVKRDFAASADIRWQQGVMGFAQNVTAAFRTCRMLKGKLPYCDANPNSQAFVVTLTRTLPPNADTAAFVAAGQAAEVFACPSPTTFDGCHALFFQKAQPIIDEIMDFVRSTKPLVENEIAATPK